jgi:hypothetical protein
MRHHRNLQFVQRVGPATTYPGVSDSTPESTTPGARRDHQTSPFADTAETSLQLELTIPPG